MRDLILQLSKSSIYSTKPQPIKEIDDLIKKYPALLEKDEEQVLFKGDVLLTFLKVFEEYIKEIEAVITPPRQTKSLFQ